MNRKQIESIIRRAENTDLATGQRLAAAVAAARYLAAEIVDAETEASAVASDNRSVRSRLQEWADSRHVGHGDYARGRSAKWLAITVPRAAVVDELIAARQRAAELAARLELLDQYLAAFCAVRGQLLELPRRNAAHVRLASALAATKPADKWRGTKSRADHVGGLHSGIIRAVQTGRWTMLRPGSSLAGCRSLLDVPTQRRGRVSRAEGERCWEYTQDFALSGDWLAGGHGGTIDGAAHHLWRINRHGGRYAALVAAVNLYNAAARGGYGGRTIETLTRASDHEIRTALAILRRGITASRAAAARRLIDRLVASPAGAQSLALTAPETVATIQRGAIVYSVLRWQSLANGSVYWEYGLAHHDSPEAECIPDHVRTFHLDDADNDRAIRVLTDRLADAERSADYRRRSRRSAEEARRLQRQRTAAVARTLRALPRVSLADSYAVGNCRPGTAEFCRLINVSESELSGTALCRRWRAAGWPDNSLFVRVVERLAGGTVDAK